MVYVRREVVWSAGPEATISEEYIQLRPEKKAGEAIYEDGDGIWDASVGDEIVWDDVGGVEWQVETI